MRFFISVLAVFFLLPLNAQKQKNLTRYYTLQEVYDSTLGINIYEKLNFSMGGDSVRYNPKGYVAQGVWEDYYKDGTVLHNGYYVDGQLRTYKNFFPDGKTEREFQMIGFTDYRMTIWYPDGHVRSDITYYQGQEQVTHEYYLNGNPEIAEEYSKKCEYLMYRTFYYENGKTQSDLQIADKKKKRYYLKEYYENGNLQDEGPMQYYEEIDNYMKDGTWKVYDENGKQVATQEYVKGQLTEEKKL